MINELRIYTAAPGKLQELIERFRDHATRIMKRYDIRPIGFWTPDDPAGSSDFYYLLEWDDMAHHDRAMAAFRADQDWLSVRETTETNGPLLVTIKNTFLKPAGFAAR